MPAFSGRDPVNRNWVKVDDLLWIDGSEVEAYERGLVFDGNEYVPFAQSLPANVAARDGYRLRTDHVAVSSSCSWEDAVTAARAAEAHVMRLMLAYGDRLDLRLPYDPLPVVVTHTRAEFERILYGIVADPVTWGAFYDAAEGVVYVSMEPAPKGALPWVADLRHEMTHQVLDLSRRQSLRGRPFPEGWFWLWEGIAIHSETLGDPEGTDSGAMRLERFNKRMAWKQWDAARHALRPWAEPLRRAALRPNRRTHALSPQRGEPERAPRDLGSRRPASARSPVRVGARVRARQAAAGCRTGLAARARSLSGLAISVREGDACHPLTPCERSTSNPAAPSRSGWDTPGCSRTASQASMTTTQPTSYR